MESVSDMGVCMTDIEPNVVSTDFEEYGNIFSDINTIVIEVQPHDCVNEVEVETEPDNDLLCLDPANVQEEIEGTLIIKDESQDSYEECISIMQSRTNTLQPKIIEINDNTDDEMEREYISFEDEEVVEAVEIKEEQFIEIVEDPVEKEMRNIFEGDMSNNIKLEDDVGQQIKKNSVSKVNNRQVKNNSLKKSPKSTLNNAVQNLFKNRKNINNVLSIDPNINFPRTSKKRVKTNRAVILETVNQANLVTNQSPRMRVEVQEIISPKKTQFTKKFKSVNQVKVVGKQSQRLRVEVQEVLLPKRVKLVVNTNKSIIPVPVIECCKPKLKTDDASTPADSVADVKPRSAHLKCVLCSFECTSKRSLIQHVKSHSEDKNSFECPTCKKVFTQQCNLKRHMRCHSGERPYTCQYCQKLFADQGYLTTHLRYHTNTKPYECSVCCKTFFDRSNYIKHLKSHSGEKPYPCGLCGKSFLQQSDLTRHSRVHSGERPFKCTYCDRSFTQHGDLTTHLRHHTGERPFVCTNCQKTFANKRYLNSHVKGQICMKVSGAKGKNRASCGGQVDDGVLQHAKTRQ